jgi:Ca2+:H+ antiporter
MLTGLGVMETPQMTVWVTMGLLAVVTAVSYLILYTVILSLDTFIQLVAVTAEWLIDSINGLTDTGHISKEFVGVILLPIIQLVDNAAGSYATLKLS